MNPQAEELNQIIRQKSPAVYDMLSERGKNIFFPKKGILGQTAEAKGTRINATIGAAVEDDGTPMRLETIASKINLDPSLVFPYAPSFGRPDLRSKWKSMIYEKNPSLGEKELSLPVVTNALTHGISMAGYLFADAGDEVIVPSLFWGNYNLTLANGYGANLVKFNLFKNNQFDLEAFEAKLNEGGVGKKILILNFPNNPTGYTPTQEEADGIVSIIGKAAEKGNKLVCITDDAYFGLRYEDAPIKESLFSRLCDCHPRLLAVKLDGATKEMFVWGLRVGFITYGTRVVAGEHGPFYDALEKKTAGNIRGTVSNASHLSQRIVLKVLESPDFQKERAEKVAVLKGRANRLKELLANPRYEEVWKMYPFNSGYFMCLQLRTVEAETLRVHLLDKYRTGLIATGKHDLRVAFSSVDEERIETLFENIYKGIKDLEG